MRKILRKVFLLLGVSAIALVFQACYGIPQDNFEEDEDEYKTEGEPLDVSEDVE